jgi:hypothetical protein
MARAFFMPGVNQPMQAHVHVQSTPGGVDPDA